MDLFYFPVTSLFPGTVDQPLMLCGALSPPFALVSAILPLPLTVTLSSTSRFCPPPDSLSILQVAHILSSSCWPGRSLSSSCSFPNGLGCPDDWGFLSAFSSWLCLCSFLGPFLWLSSSSDLARFSFFSFLWPSTNFFRPIMLCRALSTPSALVPAVLPLPLVAALSSTSHFCFHPALSQTVTLSSRCCAVWQVLVGQGSPQRRLAASPTVLGALVTGTSFPCLLLQAVFLLGVLPVAFGFL